MFETDIYFLYSFMKLNQLSHLQYIKYLFTLVCFLLIISSLNFYLVEISR